MPQGTVAGLITASGADVWVVTDDVEQVVLVPSEWRVLTDPLRVTDASGELRLQAGDVVEFAESPQLWASDLTVIRRSDRQPVVTEIPPVGADGRPDGFLVDLRRAVSVWRQAPMLPLTAVVLAAVSMLPQLLQPRPAGCGHVGAPACTSGSFAAYVTAQFFTIPVLIAALGYYGAERAWYREFARGHRPRVSRALALIPRYIGRYLRLGLLLLAFSIPLLFVSNSSGAISSGVRISIVAIASLVIDVLLTFVTPALAFNTSSAWRALGIGLRMLRTGWPNDLPYLLVPPLAATLFLRIAPISATGAGLVITTCLAPLMTSACAGATAFLYLRLTGDRAHEGQAISRVSA
ncbi:MAG: hypothetical protein JO222_04195 [Frankiales bacterium]|nr:hypothetical protein [Frankiales bacterium]